MDSSFSKIGNSIFLRPFQFLVRHRGIVHSFTFAVLAAALLAMFWPVVSLGFFMGFSVHLICDSFTVDGIQPFWPLKARSSGLVKTGGRIEESLFFSLIFIDALLFIFVFVLG
jgi:inner membrane protein